MAVTTESNTEVASQPEPAPAPQMSDPESRFPRAAIITIAILVLAVAATVLFTLGRGKTTNSVAHSSDLNRPRIHTIRLKGTTEAVQMRVVVAPQLAVEHVSTLTITNMAPAGTKVKPGDLLVEFDRQAQTREFINKQAEYENLAAKVLEEQAKESGAQAKDETEIRQAESALGKAELEMQKVELLSRIDAEKAQETLDEAKATLQQLRETFDLKRKAARAGIHFLEIQRDRAQQVMLHAKSNASLMEVHSPIEGVVVLPTIWKQGKMGEVQVGDQVQPGVAFMDVVDPSLMQVRVQANQEDFLLLRIGQSAKVHLDAYPELIFPGKLEEMGPIGRSGDFSSKLRNFTVIFSIAGSDPRLMPDLSAAVDVQPAEQASIDGELPLSKVP